jgi:hypothetical protein
MRPFCIVLLGACLCVLSVTLGSARIAALAQIIPPSSLSKSQLVRDAKIVCGAFDGSSGARTSPEPLSVGRTPLPAPA